MSNWEDVRYFLAIARSGTLSGAARILKVDHATVSRRLSALETALDVRLVDRLPRRCYLTATGKRVFEKALEMEAGADGISRLAKAAHVPLVGRISLSAPPVLVTHLLGDHLVRFRAECPDILLSVLAQGQQISLTRREADVALRLVRPTEPSSVTRKIGAMAFGLYAHRAYADLENPDNWQFVAFDEKFADMPQQRWLLDFAGERSVVCELSHINEHLIAVRAGIGIAGLPCFIGDQDKDLVRIYEGAQPFVRDIWLAVHRDLRNTPAIRKVMDFVTTVVTEHPILSIS